MDLWRVLAQVGLAGFGTIPRASSRRGQQRQVALARLWLSDRPRRSGSWTALHRHLDKQGVRVLEQLFPDPCGPGAWWCSPPTRISRPDAGASQDPLPVLAVAGVAHAARRLPPYSPRTADGPAPARRHLQSRSGSSSSSLPCSPLGIGPEPQLLARIAPASSGWRPCWRPCSPGAAVSR